MSNSYEKFIFSNEFLNAILIYEFLKAKGKTEFLYIFFILPILLDEKLSKHLRDGVKNKLTYFIRNVMEVDKKMKNNSFFIQNNELIHYYADETISALDVCLSLSWLNIEYENGEVILTLNREIQVKTETNNIIKKAKKFGLICRDSCLNDYISFLKVGV